MSIIKTKAIPLSKYEKDQIDNLAWDLIDQIHCLIEDEAMGTKLFDHGRHGDLAYKYLRKMIKKSL